MAQVADGRKKKEELAGLVDMVATTPFLLLMLASENGGFFPSLPQKYPTVGRRRERDGGLRSRDDISVSGEEKRGFFWVGPRADRAGAHFPNQNGRKGRDVKPPNLTEKERLDPSLHFVRSLKHPFSSTVCSQSRSGVIREKGKTEKRVQVFSLWYAEKGGDNASAALI